MNKLKDENYTRISEIFEKDVKLLYFKILEAYIIMEEYKIYILNILILIL